MRLHYRIGLVRPRSTDLGRTQVTSFGREYPLNGKVRTTATAAKRTFNPHQVHSKLALQVFRIAILRLHIAAVNTLKLQPKIPREHQSVFNPSMRLPHIETI